LVDQYSEISVSAHNSLVESFKIKASIYKGVVSNLNAMIIRFNSDADFYNASFAGEYYHQSDMATIRSLQKEAAHPGKKGQE
jgi:hypothetical protein